MNDQLKPQAEQGHRMSLPRESAQTPASGAPLDDAEQQMRRALGLFGDTPRPRQEPERTETPRNLGGGFLPGAHRRRFVQDGEVPVTVVHRATPEHAASGQAAPTSSRLQRVEAALAAETAARERAERALHETQVALQALQTKIGHNELARNEAIAAAQRSRDELVTLREELTAKTEALTEAEARANDVEADLRAARAELTEERRGRKLAERLLREATEEAAARAAEPSPPPPLVLHVDDESHAKPRRGRPRAVPPPAQAEEQEPVKWWLLPAKTVGKRR